jgi:hypothetical protein
MKRIRAQPVPHVRKGKVMKLEVVKRGYRRVQLCKLGVTHRKQVHTLVLLAFRGAKPDGHICRHLNGVTNDNRLGNLAWGTYEQNESDKDAHKTRQIGERHPMSKLSDVEARQIKRLLKSGKSQRSIASRFSVCQGTVASIALGNTWRHV